MPRKPRASCDAVGCLLSSCGSRTPVKLTTLDQANFAVLRSACSNDIGFREGLTFCLRCRNKWIRPPKSDCSFKTAYPGSCNSKSKKKVTPNRQDLVSRGLRIGSYVCKAHESLVLKSSSADVTTTCKRAAPATPQSRQKPPPVQQLRGKLDDIAAKSNVLKRKLGLQQAVSDSRLRKMKRSISVKSMHLRAAVEALKDAEEGLLLETSRAEELRAEKEASEQKLRLNLDLARRKARSAQNRLNASASRGGNKSQKYLYQKVRALHKNNHYLHETDSL